MSRKIKKQETRDLWTRRVQKQLIGKTITKIEYLSDEETKKYDWYKVPVAIQLDGKIWLVPMQDDEGNDGGAISTNIKDLPVIPVIY